MNSKNIGLILTHFFVREGEEDRKYKAIYNAVNINRKKFKNLYIILAGHGCDPPKKITSIVDHVIWSYKILENQIGCGHPLFVIQALRHLADIKIQKTLKLRAYDFVNEGIADIDKLVYTEQTNFNIKKVGDLVLFGETQFLLSWWSCGHWDYSHDGLRNLYNNLNIIRSVDWLRKEGKYIHPYALNWKTVEHGKALYWGQIEKYVYFNKLNELP